MGLHGYKRLAKRIDCNMYSTEIAIRRANEHDAGELSQMICENAKMTLAPHYSKQQWEIFITYYSADALRTKINQQIIFCAESNGEIIGCGGIDRAFVVGFYTRINFFNRGIGTRVMKHLEAYALERDFKELQLAASPTGLNFYLNHGWQKVKDIIIDHYGVGFEEKLMLKRLTHE
jgi:N-acetylglutamate synthase-like GNAT family acetyltransferase